MRKLLYGCFVAFSLTCSNALAILGPGDNQPDFTLDLHGTTQPFDLYSNLSGRIHSGFLCRMVRALQHGIL